MLDRARIAVVTVGVGLAWRATRAVDALLVVHVVWKKAIGAIDLGRTVVARNVEDVDREAFIAYVADVVVRA
jgi:hypothetical protein